MSKKAKKEGWIVPVSEKLAMVIGSGSIPAMQTFVGTFLAIYLLMVGIDAKIAAVVLLVIKAWDAIDDVVFGYLVDKVRFKERKSKFGKWVFSGRYMPWFRILILIIPVGTLIIFNLNTSLPLSIRIAQYVFGYVLFDAGCTVSGAYGLLPLSMTNNYDERNFLLAWTVMGQGLGSLPVVFLGTMLVAGSLGYSGAATVFSIIGLVLAIIPALFVKERNVTDYDEKQMKEYNIKEMFKVLKTLPELIALGVGNLLWGIFYTQGFGLFEAYYLYNNPMLSVITTMFAVIPTIVLTPLLPLIYKRIDKIVLARIACLIFAVSGAFVYFPGPPFFIRHLPLLFMLGAFSATGYTMTMMSSAQLVPDLAELAKYRSGKDVAGIVGAVMSFISKMVNSLVTSISLLILSAYGWQSVEANSFEELAKLNEQGIGLQTDLALRGLWNVGHLFPMFGFALAFVAYLFVRVKKDRVQVYMKVNSGVMTREEGEAQLAALK
ncbi:MAG: MFS transporter [Treponema sp.]|jgi:Na+/melibiose symporter-like transporter|nr:MFS transporter [Treponema sp.]